MSVLIVGPCTTHGIREELRRDNMSSNKRNRVAALVSAILLGMAGTASASATGGVPSLLRATACRWASTASPSMARGPRSTGRPGVSAPDGSDTRPRRWSSTTRAVTTTRCTPPSREPEPSTGSTAGRRAFKVTLALAVSADSCFRTVSRSPGCARTSAKL